MTDIWNQVLDCLRSSLPSNAFNTWIKPLKARSDASGTLTLEAPNKFFKEWIKENYLDVIEDVLKDILHEKIRVEVVVNKRKPHEERLYGEDERIQKALKAFNPRYTFDNFVVGSGNQLAHAASMAVADNPGTRYNPLFIYGGVGLGKTHLLNAIGQEIITKRRVKDPLKVCYISAEEFTNDLINSIRFEKMDEFRKRYRSIEVLLIDDIQFLSGKERTQIEFFHTFNSLYQNKKQIVITSDKFPRDIASIEERLRSRFEWGLIADIQPPDMETKVAILKKKAELENIPLPDDVAFYLASKIDSNVRILEGCLIRLGAFASLTKRRIDMELAKEVLRHVVKEEEPINLDRILSGVSAFFNVKIKDICSRKRMRSVVLPRQVAMYLAKRLTDVPLVEIGRKLGGKDHSTVLYAIKKIEEKVKRDPVFKEMVEELERKVRG